VTSSAETAQPQHVIVCVDGPNADNQAAAWGAWNAFDNERIHLAGVVVSGTCVDYRPQAPLGSRDDALSGRMQELHTARMAGLFRRAGSSVPVFIGKPVQETDITTPIPHNTHVRHEAYDIFNDNTGTGRGAIAGNFQDALSHIASLQGTVHIVVGGPFTEIPPLIEHTRIAPKLGHLAAQAGFDIASRPIYSKLAFNVDVDMLAALKTLLLYPGPIFAVPSDITRAPEATFRSAEELLRLGVYREIGDIFIRHRAQAAQRHKNEQRSREAAGGSLKAYPDLSIHDLQAVMALQQSLGLERGIFEFSEINIPQAIANILTAVRMHTSSGLAINLTAQTAPSLGWLGDNQTNRGTIPPRYVVTHQNAPLYKQKAIELLRTKHHNNPAK
jgi:hypothetical protein